MIYEIPNADYPTINAAFPNRIEFGFERNGKYYFDSGILQYLDVDYDSIFQGLYGQNLADYLSDKPQAQLDKNPEVFGFETTLQTSSTEYAPMSGMSVTPEEGDYYVKFGGYASMNKSRDMYYAVFKNGAIIQKSERAIKPNNNKNFIISTEAVVKCEGNDTIEIRYKISDSKTNLKVYNRNLTTIKTD
jgi:hypothetical protein